MATIKVFDVNGVKELVCFSTLDNLPYLDEVQDEEQIVEEKNPFE